MIFLLNTKYTKYFLFSIFDFKFNLLFCGFSDEEDSEASEKVSAKLETVDQEIDNLDITFVKIADTKYARKWGVTTLPSLVYFRKRFPSIYRGQCLKP